MRQVIWQFCLLIGVFTLTACSPGMISGLFSNSSKPDSKVENLTSYRKINTQCGEMNLSTAEMDNATFRALVKCLNNNNSIVPIAKFVDQMDEGHVSAFTRFANETVLNNPLTLYKIDHTYSSLDKLGMLREVHQQFGKLLKNDEFIISSLKFIKGAYRRNDQTLKAVEILARQMTYEKWQKMIDIGKSLTGSKIFQSLFDELKTNTRTTVSTETLVDSLSQYLLQSHTYRNACGQNVPIHRELKRAFQSGILFNTMNELLGTNEEGVKYNVPRLAAIIEATFRNDLNPNSFSNLTQAFQQLNGQPISCMGNAIKIPDAAMHLIRELSFVSPSDAAKYILRDNRLNLFLLGPYCELPPAMNQHYSALAALARVGYSSSSNLYVQTNSSSLMDSSVMEPMTSMLQTLYRPVLPPEPGACLAGDREDHPQDHPMITFFINVLSDPSITKLSPVFTRFTELGLWNHFLLFSALPDLARQQDLIDFIHFMIEPQSELAGQSLYETLIESHLTPEGIAQLRPVLLSLRGFLSFSKDDLEKIFDTLRKVEYVNNVHPFLDVFLHAAKNATQNREFFEAIFDLVEKQEFRDVLQFVKQMSENGDLDLLTASVVKLYHRFALTQKDRLHIRAEVAPSFTPGRKHNLDHSELFRKKLSVVNSSSYGIMEDCDLINLDQNLLTLSDKMFSQVMSQTLRCYKENYDPALFDGLVYFKAQQMRTGPSGGESFFDYQMNLVKQLFHSNDPLRPSLNQFDLSYLLNVTEDAVTSGRLQNVTRLLPLIINHHWEEWREIKERATQDSVDKAPISVGPVLEPALGVLSGLISDPNIKPHWKEFGKFGAHFLRREDFPKHLADIHAVLERANDISDEDDKASGPLQSFEPPLGAQTSDVPICEPGGPIPQSIRNILNRIVLTQYQNLTWDLEQRPVEGLKIIQDWVRSKECESLPIDPELRERQVYQRACEIVFETQADVNNFDYLMDPVSNPGSNPGPNPSIRVLKSKQSWTLGEVKALLDPILKKIKDPSQNLVSRNSLDAQINFMRYFSLPHQIDPLAPSRSNGSDAKQLESDARFLALKRQFSPDDLMNWLFERSVDYQLISYYYLGPDENQRADFPRVRLVNSIDRFEIILNMVDIKNPKFPLTNNLALAFLSEIARGWGDEPMENWPPEIKEYFEKQLPRVHAGKLPDIARTVEGIVNRFEVFAKDPLTGMKNPTSLYQFEDLKTLTNYFIGLPRAMGRTASCSQGDLNLQTPILPDPQSTYSKDNFWGMIGSVPISEQERYGFQGRLFNLWQTVSVLKESIPGGQIGLGAVPGNLGLKPLRNLFFEVLYSTPEQYREQLIGEKTNLFIILNMVRLGAFHQVGKVLQRAHMKVDGHGQVELNPQTGLPIIDDALVRHFFQSLVHASVGPALYDVMDLIIHKGEYQDQNGNTQHLVYQIIEPIFQMIDAASAPDATTRQKKTLERMKQSSVLSLALLDRLKNWNPAVELPPNQDIVPLGLGRLKDVLEQHRFFLSTPGGQAMLKDLLASKQVANLLRAAYETFSDGTEAGESMHKLLVEWLCSLEDTSNCGLNGSIQRLPIQSGVTLMKKLYGDESLLANLDRFSSRLNTMKQSSEYRVLNVKEALRPILEFFEQKGTSSAENELAKNLAFYIAQRLELGDFEDILLLYSTNPQGFYHALSSLSQPLETADFSGFHDLIKMMKRTLSESKN